MPSKYLLHTHHIFSILVRNLAVSSEKNFAINEYVPVTPDTIIRPKEKHNEVLRKGLWNT
ncbi:uncharacterized protein PRCAT00005249001 [Priceomyces carsonii]|uniref:uncharacterized protein n=1 Tax=Priceomyces carsonii TaxID=28549 RepID=UPI002ED9E493|nr:unnamed protein product [Priceomyces carsonii]